MRPIDKSYPSKLLLFGEYTVLHSGTALAIPINRYCGNWNYEKKQTASNLNLKQLLPHFEKIEIKGFNKEAFTKDIGNGLSFDTNIFQGYGLGSSASLIAAIYDRYVSVKNNNLIELRNTLASMESYYHGKSSGVDPLVCYLNKSVLLENNEIRIIEPPLIKDNFFLIDTKVNRRTNTFVLEYLDRYNTSKLFRSEMDRLNELNLEAIGQLEINVNALFEMVKQISEIQFMYFKKMIPDAFHEIWESSLKSDLFSIKLNGAGGGGFLLGYTNNLDLVKVEQNIIQL